MRIFKLLILICCLSANTVQAQANSYFQLKDDGHMYDIIRTSTNDYLTLGSHSSQGVKKLQLVKWDASFNEQWNYEFSSVDVTAANLICFLRESQLGSYYLCVPTPDGNAVVFKIASDGNLIWQKEYGVNGFVIANAFHTAPPGDDGFIFGTGSCSVSNGLVKCDQDGNIEWQKVFSRSDAGGVVTCKGIVNHGNGYIVTSQFNGDSFVNQKIDAAGNLISYKAYKNNSKSMGPDNTINYGDGVAIIGAYNSTNNNVDMFVCYVDSNLTLTVYNDLVTTVGSTIYYGDFCVDGSGQNILVNGNTYNGTYSAHFIYSLSPTGSLNWNYKSVAQGGLLGITAWDDRVISSGNGPGSKPIISITDDTGAGFCDSVIFDVTSNHPALTLLAGVSSSYNVTSFWDSTATVAYTNNIEFNRTMICGPAPVGFEAIEAIENLSIYPNPVSESIMVEFGSNSTVELTVTDLSGKVLFNESNFVSGSRIDLLDFNSGMYLIHLKSDAQVISQKFIKE